MEDELGLEIDFAIAVELRQGSQGLVRIATGEEVLELRPGQRPDAQPNAALGIPDLVSQHRAIAQSNGARELLVVDAILKRIGNPIPGADELLDLDGNTEVVGEHLLQPHGAPAVHRQQSAIEDERRVADIQSIVKPGIPQADEIADMPRTPVLLIPLEWH